MKNIEIRDAQIYDAKAIANIHVKAWQFAYKDIIPDDYLSGLSIDTKTENWKKKLENLDEGVHAIVAIADDKVVGWCTFGKNRDLDAKPTTGELHGIYVIPEQIGTGAGSKLMENVIETLKSEGYTKATLWVLSDNETTKQWYEKKGWKADGTTKVEERKDFNLNEMRYSIDL